jgi:hypothetical protein
MRYRLDPERRSHRCPRLRNCSGPEHRNTVYTSPTRHPRIPALKHLRPQGIPHLAGRAQPDRKDIRDYGRPQMREISPAHAQQHPVKNAGVDWDIRPNDFWATPVNRTPVNPGRTGNAVFRPSMDFSVPTSAAREARGRGANDATHGRFPMLAAQRAQGESSPNQTRADVTGETSRRSLAPSIRTD